MLKDIKSDTAGKFEKDLQMNRNRYESERSRREQEEQEQWFETHKSVNDEFNS